MWQRRARKLRQPIDLASRRRRRRREGRGALGGRAS
jgi:hypothetical protein